MSIFKLIQLGFLSIFGFNSGMHATRRALEEFSKEMQKSASEDFDNMVSSIESKSDKQRLREDWERISQDLSVAYRKTKQQLALDNPAYGKK